MSFTHKPGIDSGIDYGLIAVLLIWIVAAILLVLLALRSHAAELPGPPRPLAGDTVFLVSQTFMLGRMANEWVGSAPHVSHVEL